MRTKLFTQLILKISTKGYSGINSKFIPGKALTRADIVLLYPVRILYLMINLRYTETDKFVNFSYVLLRMAITKLSKVIFVMAIKMKINKEVNHSPTILTSEKSSNSNYPIDTSNKVFIIDHRLSNYCSSTIEI